VTRWRSPDWVYTYLKSYYVDETRPYGVNNLIFDKVGMPHALINLQGVQKPIYAEATADRGRGAEHVVGLELVEPGELTVEEYDTWCGT
jgi:ubiquinol-cytochrome c reductase cytochrome c1 subunit